MQMKHKSRRCDINRPWARHGHKCTKYRHKYTKYKQCLSMMMCLYVLSNA